MKNFLTHISQAVLNDTGTDTEKIKKWPSTDVQSDIISDTYSSVKNPPGDVNKLCCRRFNAPGIGIKRKRKSKVARHFILTKTDNNTAIEGGKIFDVFANDESQTSVTYSSCCNRFKNLTLRDKFSNDQSTKVPYSNQGQGEHSAVQVTEIAKQAKNQ